MGFDLKNYVKSQWAALFTPVQPKAMVTKYNQSLVESLVSSGNGKVKVYYSDWKRLERNKYAPWGRGDLGGKAV